MKYKLSPISVKLISILCAPLSAALIYTAFWRASLDTYDAARLYSVFESSMEHIMMSLTVIVCGTLLLDIEEKKRKKK